MTRRDIRRGTTLTMLFSVCICTLIIITLWRHPGAVKAQPSIQQAAITAGRLWSDTLTNVSSAYAPLQAMDREIERFLDKWDIKGVSLAVTRNDSLLYAKGYGWADREEGRRMEATTIMRMASASKLVTAIAVMKLCEEGRLSLQSRVFGPEGILNDSSYTSAMCDPRMLDITVDHLLLHQGGFGRGAGDPMFTTREIMAAKRLDTPPTPEELIRIVLGRRIAFTPGAGRIYSNFGYMVLSMVIERITGRSYWEYVTDNILKPAGCHGFRPATNYYAERSEHETRYYGPDNEQVEEFNGSGRLVDRVYGGSDVRALKGGGGWCASAADIARLIASVDGCPVVDNILNPTSLNTLTAYGNDDHKLARGWTESDGRGRWTRTGTLSSTHALVEHFPDGECWVILTNSGVWTGYHFSRELQRLVERFRSRYSTTLPTRNLF